MASVLLLRGLRETPSPIFALAMHTRFPQAQGSSGSVEINLKCHVLPGSGKENDRSHGPHPQLSAHASSRSTGAAAQ